MIKAANVIGFYVKNISATLDFYKKLGLDVVNETNIIAEFMAGSIKLQFIDSSTAKDQAESFQKDAFGEPKGTGIYINIEVDSIDEFYQLLINAGLKPSTSPRDWPWGNREFVIRDPDGYKLVIYQKI